MRRFGDLFSRYADALLAQMMQSVACNALHRAEERCARWLLMTHDRVPGDAFELTHEFVAQYDVNALGMNDEPVEASEKARIRLLALGDSHTFAAGVSMDGAWPNRPPRRPASR